MVIDRPIADELYLGHAGDGFEVRMQDGFLCASCFIVSVTVTFRRWVERLTSGVREIDDLTGSAWRTLVNAY